MSRRPLTTQDLLDEARRAITRYTAREALAAQQAGAIIVDTRCAEDREAEGAIPGAVAIPRTVLEWRAEPEGEWADPRIARRDGQLIIVCNDGYSSSLAAANLRRMGFDRVGDLIDGFRGWKRAGLPVEDG